MADSMATKEEEEEANMAAWLLGIKTLKIQPYHLPPLGKVSSFSGRHVTHTHMFCICIYSHSISVENMVWTTCHVFCSNKGVCQTN